MHIAYFPDASLTQAILKLIYAAALCYGCISDVRYFKIPNFIPAAAVTLFFLNYWLQSPQEGLLQHAAAGGLVFLLSFGLYLAGTMGAGDAKLISALMLWAGVKDGPAFLIVMTFTGGLMAALLLALRSSMANWPEVQYYLPSRRLKTWAARGVLPYGIAICLAGLILMPSFFAPPR